MRKNTSACGLCKPHKKWKMNHTKKAPYQKGASSEKIIYYWFRWTR